jgi:hypothetical protein
MEATSMCPAITNLTSLIFYFTCVLTRFVVPFLMALAVVAFVYGIIQYFLNPEKNGKSFMLWGIIALFVMVSIWGLVGIFSNTLGTGPVRLPYLPER